MTRYLTLAAIFVAVAAGAMPATADEGLTFEAYQKKNPITCVGDPSARLGTPETYEVGDYTYSVNGGVATIGWKGESPHPGEVRFGVLQGIKEFDPKTKDILDDFMKKFAEQKVDAVLIGGDTAYTGADLKKIYAHLGKSGLPILAITGNNESRTHFNKAMLEAWRENKNVLNMGLVRRADFKGADVVSLPGYHLKNFASTGAACIYKPEDAKGLKAITAEADDPVVLLTHGPPKQSGKNALDFVPDAGNVGDEHLTNAVKTAGIKFGIAGHILEAGARATDLAGTKDVPRGKPAAELFLNPGQANSLPYKLTLGWTAHGTATLMTIKDGKASWDLWKQPGPDGKDPEPAAKKARKGKKGKKAPKKGKK